MTATPPPARTLPELLARCAAEVPHREALVAGTQRFSYADLARETAASAVAIGGLGIGDGDRVALLAPNIAGWIPIAIAAQALGARVDAFNTWVKAYDLAHLLTESQAGLLVMADGVRGSDLLGEAAALLPELTTAASPGWRSARFPSIRSVAVLGDRVPPGAYSWNRTVGAARGQAHDLRSLSVDPANREEDTAFVVYTSGSTKQPKAVPLAHRNLIVNGFHIGERLRLGGEDRVWFASPLFWSFGCANALMATMTHQACFVLQERFEAREAAELMRREHVTAAYLLPTMSEALEAAVPDELRALECLQTGVTIGRPDEVERAAVTLGISGICNVYGATETYGNCCVTDRQQPLDERLHTQGQPLPGVELRIVEPETGDRLDIGAVGELHVRGRITPGYLNDDEANAAAFSPDGWYRTGDRMTINSDGSVTYLGRLSDMIKTSGINVSPAEVETFLSTHPDIAQAVVLGAPHPTRDEVVVAFVVPRDDALTAETVIQYCRDNIASYKVPWVVSLVPSLPQTGTGKVSRRDMLDAATSLVRARVDSTAALPR